MSVRHASFSMHRLFVYCFSLACLWALATMAGCRGKSVIQRQTKIVAASSANGRVEDISFRSPSLQRTMQYRVVLPDGYLPQSQSPLPVLYLLHSRGGSYADWYTGSHVTEIANHMNFVLVMPQGDESYYLNAALNPGSRYEDYITGDLVRDVELHYRVSTERNDGFCRAQLQLQQHR
jgi:S-formylglutathione hydrolase FrmB